MTARYVVGIDLGTTNCALSYASIPGEDESTEVQNFPIPQLVAASTIEARSTLPSFLYQADENDFKDGALDLPWRTTDSEGADPHIALGTLARDHGAKRPQRLISSAKSWLCHSGVDRDADILPWDPSEDDDSNTGVPKCSPVKVAEYFLSHLRDAWNDSDQGHGAPLEEQEIFLTVPASFDAVARELTVQAAKNAGLGDVVLLEEPLAAFYAWLYSRGEDWRKDLEVGDRVLVCDIGGGTTDFSLIEAREEAGDLTLERVAVGEHILLGGDNMDLTLSQVVARKIKQKKKKFKLDPWQSRALWYQCREAKERLLSNPDLEEAAITLLGRGSKLIGNTVKSKLTRDEIESVLLEGFFPQCATDDEPQSAEGMGLQEIGLPYARDPAITRHVAAFLSQDGDFKSPSTVLVNGGVFKGTALRERLHSVLRHWAEDSGQPEPRLLAGTHLDLAVATGAAYYGLARRGKGIRVRGGTARSYYIAVQSNMPAVPGMPLPVTGLCVVPFGLEPGTAVQVPGKSFNLVVGQPVEFRLLSSVKRQEDEIGERIEDDELEETAPIRTTLEGGDDESGQKIKVRLQSEVTEVGTLDLRCVAVDGERDWKLSFNIRDAEDS